MVRNYKRKTNRGELPKERFNSAISSVKEGLSIRKAADLHGINYWTLARYLRKWEENGGTLERVHLGYKKARLCLTEDIENDLDDDEVETSFMRSKLSADGRKVFAFPDHEDSCSHLVKDNVMKLPWPTTGTTSRAAKTFDFHCPVWMHTA